MDPDSLRTSVSLYQLHATAASAVREAATGHPGETFATTTYVLLDSADEAREWAAA